ncbi:MAG TPA: DUF2336 domain-containing protein, partial [Rhizomicrobium sp.]|nr:DUF2336 domain-containing protein [Rhizomicrobium sp.]
KLDDATRSYLKQQMQKRIESGESISEAPPSPPVDLSSLHKKGKLDDAFVERAIDDGSRAAVTGGLALLASVPQDAVVRIFDSGLAKPITALVWRAGLGMRVAFKIQTLLLKLPAGEVLPARDGVRFPMSEDEMRWHLSYFDVKG